ncbi:LOW QUALITY PROTEIN: uncharacterized protein LOC118734285 [Rhagoletis pomonella]|uniref:LOW QUALITY PROTEIN: uncharacterized protein LOC118734285 n=1 Tax=Rhagoletis pomonella TaxID=28610 RepID=UPI0017871B29|nr:LOW QUALITY PROTEIN: uncharacterized protein LOC118734285 [Rhagoletis pomonella]
MSYIGANTSDAECERGEQQKTRHAEFVSKLAANKLSLDSKWSNKKDDESGSELSYSENFLTRGAFLLTPLHELSMERAALICEKMNFKGCFSLTKTATGILFKFSHPDDYQAVYKKGFHKVTGARFYRKIAIPCRPKKTFTLFVMDVPEDLPVEDIRHALYKFDSIVEVVRLHYQTQPTISNDKGQEGAVISRNEVTEKSERRESPAAVIRITLASMDEYNILLQNGLNFYDATFFPTEANLQMKGAKIDYKRRIFDGNKPSRVRELLPVFDATGFRKLPPPASKLIKPSRIIK